MLQEGILIMNGIQVAQPGNPWVVRYLDKTIVVDSEKGTIAILDEERETPFEYRMVQDSVVLYEGDIPLYRIIRFKREDKHYSFDLVLPGQRILIDHAEGTVTAEPWESKPFTYVQRQGKGDH